MYRSRYMYDVREYQAQGTNFLRAVKRGFLTDEPGLGKTIQAIRAVELPCMVIAPKHLILQWEASILQEDPKAKIASVMGTRTQRDMILDKQADWYILNYEMLATYDLPPDMRTFINDESHRLRNRHATLTHAAYEIENRVKDARIYHLSATPMWKAPDDIWMQAHILYPQVSVFKSHKRFVDLFCVSLRSPFGGPKVVSIKRAMRGPLKDLLAPIMLGRTYKDVGRYLPDTIETVIELSLPKAHRNIYKQMVDNYSIEYGEDKQKLIFEATTVLHALRQVTAHAGKFDAIKSLLEDNLNIPAIIGFWYRDHAKYMYELLPKGSAVLLTGEIDSVERNRLALQAQSRGQHIVATQDSIREGTNLSKYKLFVFGEQHYVPESNRQFMTRAVRDRNDGGKDKEPVRVFYVCMKGTIDMSIYKVAKKRGEAIASVREVLDRTLT